MRRHTVLWMMIALLLVGIAGPGAGSALPCRYARYASKLAVDFSSSRPAAFSSTLSCRTCATWLAISSCTAKTSAFVLSNCTDQRCVPGRHDPAHMG